MLKDHLSFSSYWWGIDLENLASVTYHPRTTSGYAENEAETQKNRAQNLADNKIRQLQKAKHNASTCKTNFTYLMDFCNSLDRNGRLSRTRSIACVTSFFQFVCQISYCFYSSLATALPMVSAVDTQCLYGIFSVEVVNVYNSATFFPNKRYVIQGARKQDMWH